MGERNGTYTEAGSIDKKKNQVGAGVPDFI